MVALAGYTILEKLHTGPYTETYRCLREKDKQAVILKLPRSEYPTAKEITTLQHEYNLLKTLNLSGVIHAYELIEQMHYPILVLEDIAGQSLEKFLTKNKLSLDQFFKIALQMIDAIGTLHQKNIIHKDIKPANIIIEPINLTVKLADLSISSQLTEENLNYISLNTLEGTLAYMSPEQTGRMNRPLDYRTDFYSLGVTFFEMLTGRLPFQTNDPLEIVHCHIAKIPSFVTELNADIPPMLAEVIAKLLAKMPEERYASAVGLKEDLAICAHEWGEHNNIAKFELGCRDMHDHLQISHKLYGREAQVQHLLTAVAKVNQSGRCGMLLVSGYSGIGKTAVIREVYKPIVKMKGYFINGKYDQLQRGTPYTAIIAAFQNLVKQVLSDSEGNLNKLRSALLATVGNVGQVIIDLIPEVELIIGKQPPIPTLNPAEAQNRFNLVFQNFVQVFARAEHPLVIFLDDLQWADNASLSFIENLFSDPNTRYLFLIGAYRDNEVLEDHPLLAALQRIQKLEVSVEFLVLAPLQITDIEQMLADTFSSSKEKVKMLALLLHEKTLGNPFFICEFLKALYEEKKIQFSYERSEWQWDIASLKQTSVAHNVVDLLTEQIHKLPESTQHILKLAACIGHTFNLQTLAIISEQTPVQVAEELWKAMQARFIITLEESSKTATLAEANRLVVFSLDVEILSYQFSHDRVQHAVYHLISEETRQQVHLAIGRSLLKEHPLVENDAELFNIVNHFNQSLSLMTDPTEKCSLVRYNVWAGQKAKISAAYTAALAYFKIALTLLASDAWESDYILTFTLYKSMTECEYLLMNFANAEGYVALLLQKATLFDKLTVYIVQIKAYATVGKYEESIRIAKVALREFNFPLPEHVGVVQILTQIISIKWKTHGKKIPELANTLLKISDPSLLAITQILGTVLPSVYVVNPKLYAFLTCKLLKLGLMHGYNREMAFACLTYATLLVSQFKKIDAGFEFVALSNNINKKFGIVQSVKTSFTSGYALLFWKYPLKTSIEYLQKTYEVALEEGEIAFAGYSCFMVLARYYLGESLNEVYAECEKKTVFCKRIGRMNSYNYFLIFKGIIHSLREKFTLDNKLLNIVHDITEESKTVWAFSYNLYSQAFYLKGEYAKALEMAQEAWKYTSFSKTSLDYPFEVFFYGLCITSCYTTASKAEQKNYRKLLKQFQAFFKLGNSHCPENFEYLYLHLLAEIAMLEDKRIQAVNYYDQAIASAMKYSRIQFLALANERAAIFFLKLNKPHIAEHYILEAHHAYQRWGAFAKCELLKQHYPQFFLTVTKEKSALFSVGHTTTTVSSAQAFDKLAALKSSLAISSEIHLDKLLKKLLHIMLEDAGAERCALLGKQGDNWVVEAEGTADKQTVFSKPELVLVTSQLPTTLVSYVQRTMMPIIIQDAVHAEQTLADPYVTQNKPKSMLALPVRYQGQLRRIFYLENNLMTGAFTNRHLQMLQLLGTQAAISLENAQLYYQATHDPLTGLGNRNLLYQTFADHVNSMGHEKNKKVAILFLDLDYFKQVNDTHGHEVGDKLLIYFAEQLKLLIREGDLAVRLGGDEFVLMIKNIKSKAEINSLLMRLNNILSQPASIGGHSLTLLTSTGISLYPEDGMEIDALLRKADIALYREKELHHHAT